MGSGFDVGSGSGVGSGVGFGVGSTSSSEIAFQASNHAVPLPGSYAHAAPEHQAVVGPSLQRYNWLSFITTSAALVAVLSHSCHQH
nr:hypothetical protein [Photobacterium leiognathi]